MTGAEREPIARCSQMFVRSERRTLRSLKRAVIANHRVNEAPAQNIPSDSDGYGERRVAGAPAV